MDCNSLKVISHRLAVAGAAAVLSCAAEARLPSERLLEAIRQVETEDGRTSANVYQLRAIAVYDVNRIYGTGYRYADVFDRHVARRIVRKYLDYWSEVYRSETGRYPTDEVLARIHHGGPRGWCRKLTEKYWQRIVRVLEK